MIACPREFVDFANRLADAAGAIVRRHFRTRLEVAQKADLSPVTIADREAESAMRALIRRTFPDHGVVGEEGGRDRADAEFAWVLDPIDGTRSFVTGKPLFGTLIGLGRAGRPILGVIDHPALSERWVGAHGQATVRNGEPVRVRACPELGRAALYATSPQMFQGDDATAFERLRRRVGMALYGADCYAYGLLASGFVDLVVESALAVHDFFALVPVVEGAGGTITDWQGRALDLHSGGRVAAAGDRRAHARALALLTGAGPEN